MCARGGAGRCGGPGARPAGGAERAERGRRCLPPSAAAARAPERRPPPAAARRSLCRRPEPPPGAAGGAGSRGPGNGRRSAGRRVPGPLPAPGAARGGSSGPRRAPSWDSPDRPCAARVCKGSPPLTWSQAQMGAPAGCARPALPPTFQAPLALPAARSPALGTGGPASDNSPRPRSCRARSRQEVVK